MGADEKSSTKTRAEELADALAELLSAPVAVTPSCKISKSRYVAGIQCAKRLYLQIQQPDRAVLNEEAKALMQQGTGVGLLARQAFPGGVLVGDRDHLDDAIRTTRELIANTDVPAIFEATFEHVGVLVRVDVLERCGSAFRLVEVKSSTDVKPHYAHDVGIQRYVVEGNGVPVAVTCLMHINREYVYDGAMNLDGSRRYDLKRLFTLTDIRADDAAIVSRQLNAHFAVLSKPYAPAVEPGRHCTYPHECEFHGVCNEKWPLEDVRSLPIAKWRIDRLRERGIRRVDQLPDAFTLRAVYHLTTKECISARAAKDWTMRVSRGLAVELAALRYPVCFLDFETIWPALPWFAGMRPYDHVPFQWSLHRREEADAPLTHCDFLWQDSDDPRPTFAGALCDALTNATTIVVYNKSFESCRLQELARWVPAYRQPLTEARKKLWDLLAVLRRNVYHPEFCGSYGLKRVLPALVPGMSYEDLVVADGSHAGRTWLRLLSAKDADEKAHLRDALSSYCAQDTAALACILQVVSGFPRADHEITLPVIRDRSMGGRGSKRVQ